MLWTRARACVRVCVCVCVFPRSSTRNESGCVKPLKRGQQSLLRLEPTSHMHELLLGVVVHEVAPPRVGPENLAEAQHAAPTTHLPFPRRSASSTLQVLFLPHCSEQMTPQHKPRFRRRRCGSLLRPPTLLTHNLTRATVCTKIPKHQSETPRPGPVLTRHSKIVSACSETHAVPMHSAENHLPLSQCDRHHQCAFQRRCASECAE